MTGSLRCRACGNLIGEWQPDRRVRVTHRGRQFYIPAGGEVGCNFLVRKGVSADGALLMGRCGALTPVVEARVALPV